MTTPSGVHSKVLNIVRGLLRCPSAESKLSSRSSFLGPSLDARCLTCVVLWGFGFARRQQNLTRLPLELTAYRKRSRSLGSQPEACCGLLRVGCRAQLPSH